MNKVTRNGHDQPIFGSIEIGTLFIFKTSSFGEVCIKTVHPTQGVIGYTSLSTGNCFTGTHKDLPVEICRSVTIEPEDA